LMDSKELGAAVPFEAKRYIPIPIQEVALDWQILEADDITKRMMVLLAAVPREVVSKYERIAELLKLDLEAVEIESFSLVRSLLSSDRGVTAVINWGALVTTITVVDQRQIRMNHNFGRGSREITLTLARSLGVAPERAEALKRSVGLSDKPEDREVVSVIAPVVDTILIDLERVMMAYNRSARRKIEKVVLSGGGAGLAGLVSYVSKRLGLETILANPFARTIFPPFLQPLLKEIGPNFAVAVGLALRQIAST
ncbi:MAG: type IV pilus assembly protein PilM, partial [Patescibacteria group bacterium]